MRPPANAVLAFLAALAGTCSAPPARAGPGRKHPQESASTLGLGRNCKTKADCRHRAQRCVKESDANGKEKNVGFCVLPCAPIDSGVSPVVAGKPLEPTADNVAAAKKKPPPRCPRHYQCRSAGAGVPIDLCIKE